MKPSYLLIIFFTALSLFAFVSELRQRPDGHCDYDNTLIKPVNRVVIITPDGTEKQFCSVCCAGYWFDENPEIEDRIEAGDGRVTVVDEISGEIIDSSLAYWLKSSQLSRGENQCRVHVFKDSGDASRHILRYGGQEKPGYLAGLGMELPWAQSFTTRDVNGSGRPVTLADYRGQVVFIRFWNTGNPFTRKDLTDLAEAYRRLQDQGFTVLAVNIEQSEETVRSFIAELSLPFPVLLDTNGRIADLWEVKGFPTGFIVDKSGVIRNQSIGEILPEMMEPLINDFL